MKYTVEFGVDMIGKRNNIKRVNGEIDMTSLEQVSLDQLQCDENKNVLKGIIKQNVQPKYKQQIFNVEIIKIKDRK